MEGPLAASGREVDCELWIYHWPSNNELRILREIRNDFLKGIRRLDGGSPSKAVLALLRMGAAGSGAWRKTVRRADIVAEQLARLPATCGRPIILVGHSLGGRIALTAAQNAWEPFRGVFALAPAVSEQRVDWSRLRVGSRVRPVVVSSRNDRILYFFYRLGQMTTTEPLGLGGPPSGTGEQVEDMKLPMWRGKPVRHDSYQGFVDTLLSSQAAFEQSLLSAQHDPSAPAFVYEDAAAFARLMERDELRAELLGHIHSSLSQQARVTAVAMGLLGGLPGVTDVDNKVVKWAAETLMSQARGVIVPGMPILDLLKKMSGTPLQPDLGALERAAGQPVPDVLRGPVDWVSGEAGQVRDLGGLADLASDWAEDLTGAAIVRLATDWQCKMLGVEEGMAAYHEVKLIAYTTHALVSVFYNPSPWSLGLAAWHALKLFSADRKVHDKLRRLVDKSLAEGDLLLLEWQGTKKQIAVHDRIVEPSLESMATELSMGNAPGDDALLDLFGFAKEAKQWSH